MRRTEGSIFVGSDVRKALRRTMRGGPVLAAVAYVSNAADLPLGEGDILVCDASDGTARGGGTRRDALQELLRRGVEIWSLPGLHAKVVVANDRAVVGSANWSARSATMLTEAAVVLSDATTVHAATRFVKRLARAPGRRVDDAFLRKMPEPEMAPPPTGWRARMGMDEERRNWLLALSAKPARGAAAAMHDVLDDDVEEFVARGDSPLDFYTFTWWGERGPGAALREMDRVIVLHTDESRRTRVMPPATVIRARNEGGVLGAVLLRPRRGELRSIPLDRFAPWCAEIGIARIGARTGRRLSPEQFAALEGHWANPGAAPRQRR